MNEAPDTVPAPPPSAVENERPLTREELGPPLTLEQAKALHVQAVLNETGWNVTESARLLAVARETLHRMIRRYELDRAAPRTFERRTV